MKLISKGRFDLRQGIICFIFLAGLTVLSYYLFEQAVSGKFLQIDTLTAAVVLSFIFLYIIFKGFQEFKAVDIYENHLRIKWIWGLLRYNLPAGNIELFAKSSKNSTEYILLRTVKLDFLFLPSLLNNETELVEQLRRWDVKRKDNIYFEDISTVEKKLGGVFLIIFSVLILVITGNKYLEAYSPITDGQLIKINGVLKSEPNIQEGHARSSSQGVTFNLKEYPQFDFKIDNAGYEASNMSMLRHHTYGDNAGFKILRRDYDTKIKGSHEPSYREKHFAWDKIYLYEVRLNSDAIMSLEDYNHQAKKIYDTDRKWSLLVLGLMICMFWYGLKIYRK